MAKYFVLFFLSFSISIKAEEFLEVLKGYYFPFETFMTLEEEKELSEEFLNKVYLKEFIINDAEFKGTKKLKAIEFQKPFTFCSRLLYIWHSCGLKVWKEVEENALRFSDKLALLKGSPIICKGLREHFCYYNQEVKNPIFLDLPEKVKILQFSKNVELCERAPIYCYGLNLNFYLINNSKNFSAKESEEIKILIYRIKEIVPFNNKRILEIYGKIIE